MKIDISKLVGKVIRGENIKGTGFFVGQEYFITAKHNILAPLDIPKEEERVEIRNHSNEKFFGRTINLVQAYEKRIDCVIIELDEMVEEEEITSIIRVENNIRGFGFRTYGYPKEKTEGLELEGSVIGDSKNESKSEYRLKVKKQDMLQSYKGLSGAPIIVDNFIVGMLLQEDTSDELSGIPTSIIESSFTNALNMEIKSKSLRRQSEIEGNDSNCRFDLDLQFFRNHVNEALKIAGPRYTPQANVNNMISEPLQVYLRNTDIQEILNKIKDILLGNIKKSKDIIDDHSQESGFTKQSKLHLDQFCRKFDKWVVNICNLSEENETDVDMVVDEFYTTLDVILDEINNVIERELKLFENRNGEGTYKNKKWRGFMASYMCTFPTANLDYLFEIRESIKELQKTKLLEFMKLSYAKNLMLKGKGGIGKTHTICDVVNKNIEDGIPNLIFFGQYFEGDCPENIILNRLSIKNMTFDDLLYRLNIEGERLNKVVIIAIDALNETNDKSYWNKYLVAFMAKVQNYPFIKVITSCRSLYLSEIVEENIVNNMLVLEHTGFDGVQKEAIDVYFRYYGINIPSANKLQQEFSNPLFLKLYCELLKDIDEQRENFDIDGLSSLLNMLIVVKNKKISSKFCEYISHKDHVVQKIMEQIGRLMYEKKNNYILWSEARRIVKNVLEDIDACKIAKVLLDELISENLLKEDNGTELTVSFSFERLYDYIISVDLINEVSKENLYELSTDIIQGKPHYKGVLELLVILYKEKYSEEMITVLNQESVLYEIFLSGVCWRKVESIDYTTKRIIEYCINNRKSMELRKQAFFTIMEISLKKGCILNAEYFHNVLANKSMLARDHYLGYTMLKSYEQFDVVNKLLINAVNLDDKNIDIDIIKLWATVLVWYTSLNDIYIRDLASKALTNIFRIYPELMQYILEKFIDVDDDYIEERLWGAIYGSLILNRDATEISRVTKFIYERYIVKEDYPENVLVRDYIRNISEFSVYLNLLQYDIQKFRPPYKSHKISKVTKLINDKLKEEYKYLYYNCSNSDFVKYTVPHEVNDYGFTKEEIGEIIFLEIINMGYDQRLANLDNYIDYTYGSERSRDESVERVGKKYQKIFLYKVLGRMYDHCECNPQFMEDYLEVIPKEQGIMFRTIDLTALPHRQINSFIGNELKYDFRRNSKLSHEQWFRKDDIKEKIENVFTKKINEKRYILLQGYFNIEESKKENEENDRREIWFHVRSYLLDRINEETLLRWLKGKDFEGRWMPEGYESLYEGWIGEYPWSPSYVNTLVTDNTNTYGSYNSNNTIPINIIPTINGYTDEKDTPFCKSSMSGKFLFPALQFFDKYKLVWNGSNAYMYENKLAFLISSGKDTSIYVEEELLQQYLYETNQNIAWTILGEKQVIPAQWRQDFRRSEFSASYKYNDGKIEVNHYLFNPKC